MTKPLADRFWPKVNKGNATSCWTWEGAVNSGGYGHIKAAAPARHTTLAHHVSYELLVRPVGAGLVLDHLCRNRRCVNPAHLEEVTQKENSRRGLSVPAINARKRFCVNGHSFDDESNVYLEVCGDEVHRRCKACIKTRYEARRDAVQKAPRLPRPTKEQLALDMNGMSRVKIGFKYGVTDTAVKKWQKKYGLL